MSALTRLKSVGCAFLAAGLMLVLLLSSTCIIFAAEAATAQPAGIDQQTGTEADRSENKEDGTSKAAAVLAYREFADGSRTAAYSSENIEYAYFLSSDRFRDGTSYSLKDIISIYQAAAAEINAENPLETDQAVLTSVEYKILEEGPCPVMALQLTGDRFLSTEQTKMLYILYYDEKEDVLRFAFGRDSWSRRNVQINNAGIVTISGSSSAFEEAFTYYIVDDKGDVQHLYTVECSSRIAATASDLEEWQKNTFLCSYYLSAYPFSSEEGFATGPEYSTLHQNVSSRCDSTFAIESVGQLDPSDPLVALYSRDGTLLVNNAVVAQAILSRMDSLGISAESFFADVPLWDSIDPGT